jgi:competence protein ComEA
MKDWWKLATSAAIGVLCGLLGTGIILIASSPPRGDAIRLLPPPTPASLVVHVVGGVTQPGVYSLPAGSRVRDAIQAAGGLSLQADTQAINLAALLVDGERVLVPLLPTPTPSPLPGSAPPTSAPQANAPTPDAAHPVNINTAGQIELESLPGIGPKIAEKIITYRIANGPFSNIEEIQDVPGIGPKTFEDLKELITVGP